MEVNLSEENFEKEVLKENKAVLVDFWASWCGPCKMIAPVVQEIEEEYKDKLKVGKVNIDQEKNLAIKYQITNIPTLILFKEGQVIDTSVGLVSKSELEELLKKADII